ncbi:MAG: cardiolipin synthase ClsB [Burkholderiales bacterium]
MIQFVAGNRITLLSGGAEYFSALEEAIEGATREIHLETYIFEYDETGKRIAGALRRAAARGVAVYLLIDGFGSKDLPQSLHDALRADGVRVLVYRPVIWRWNRRRAQLRRLHRKLAVIDANLAFVGGINIIDDTDTSDNTAARIDYAVRVEGPLVAGSVAAVKRLWRLVSWSHFKRRVGTPAWPQRVPATRGDVRAAFVVRDNVRHRRAIENAYLSAIEGARSEIIIANAYFLPGIQFRNALINAARRGVRVLLLLQGHVEYWLLHYASRALYESFLDAGIEIHEITNGFLHAKVAVIDEHWCTVGSSNIDPFSLLLAREANVVIEHRPIAVALKTGLAGVMENRARRVDAHHFTAQPWYTRFAPSISYAAVRLLMGILGYGRKHGYE